MNERDFWKKLLVALDSTEGVSNEEDVRRNVVAAITALVARIEVLEAA